MPFLIIFFGIPITEVFVFLKAGQYLGLIETLLLCIFTAALGGFLVRQQGFETLGRGQKLMARGELPVHELFDGLCLVAAGALLITPGFVTDIIGFTLLFPPARAVLRRFAKSHFKMAEVKMTSAHGTSSVHAESDVIEGEYSHVDPDSISSNRPKRD